VCIIWEPIGNRPMQTNTQATKDPAWQLYLTLSKLADKESILNNNHPVDSVAWHAQNARRDAYHEATMKALECIELRADSDR